MKRIAIFCDGTWNRADAPKGTNVVQLSQAMEFLASDGTFQQMAYIQGVGTGRGTTKMARMIDRVGGGVFGWGLTTNIEEAYRVLCFSYEPGDEIYIFGFSRGAYTARSLAGLIRSSSIPPRTQVNKIIKAIERYRSRNEDTHPNSSDSYEFRLALNSDLVTSPEEQAWRQKNGHPEGKMLQVAYLGVWDTVGALGVPGHLRALAHVFNRKYRFHDAALSRSVRAARHAIAIDEHRKTFPSTGWDNLDTLNGEATGDERPYRQVWFPGNHGSVGGGGEITGLSANTLVWVAEGAQQLGLEFNEHLLDWHRGQRNPLASLDNKPNGRGWLKKLTGLGNTDRKGPNRIDLVSQSARDRWKEADPAYRPATLDGVKNALNGD